MHTFKKIILALAVTSTLSTSAIFAQETKVQSNLIKPQSNDIEAILNARPIEQFSPGVAVAVIADGKLLFSKGYGQTEVGKNAAVTADTPFYIASTTKSFTAHIASQLALNGAFSLQTPVTKLMPSLRFHPSIKADEITLERLLNHTHGIENEGPITFRTAFTGEYVDTKQLLGLLEQHPATKTGNAFAYSNIGPILAAYIIEYKTGKHWQDLIDEMIFKPMKMQHSANRLSQLGGTVVAQGHDFSVDGFRPSKIKKQDVNMHPAGGTYSSANDLAAWIGVHLQKGQWQGSRRYSEQLMSKAWLETSKQDRMAAGMKRVGWSLGWDIAEYKGQKIFLRPGGFTGYSAHISMMPERGLGVVVLTNGGQLGSMLTEHLVDSIYASLLQEPDHQSLRVGAEQRLAAMLPRVMQAQQAEKEKRAARQKPMPLPMENYAGVFQSSSGTLKCDIRQGRLHLQMGILEDDAEIFSAEKQSFRTELFGNGQVLKYIFSDDKVTGVELGGELYKKI